MCKRQETVPGATLVDTAVPSIRKSSVHTVGVDVVVGLAAPPADSRHSLVYLVYSRRDWYIKTPYTQRDAFRQKQ